jgi:hypothetical protein
VAVVVVEIPLEVFVLVVGTLEEEFLAVAVAVNLVVEILVEVVGIHPVEVVGIRPVGVVGIRPAEVVGILPAAVGIPAVVEILVVVENSVEEVVESLNVEVEQPVVVVVVYFAG